MNFFESLFPSFALTERLKQAGIYSRDNGNSEMCGFIAQLKMCGFIAQLVEQRTGNAEVSGSNPVEALIFFIFYLFIFFRLLLSNCLNWKIYCDDHSRIKGRRGNYVHN